MPPTQGIVRPRLLARLDLLLDARLGMVVAPAGAGKTTVMAQWAAHAPADVAWYRADSGDTTAGAVIGRLGAALASVSPGHPPARDLQSLVAAIERHESPLVLVVDDLHLVEHTHVGHLLQRLLLTAPPHLRLLVGSRRPPSFNLARTEVPTVIVTEEELRFRAAETAALFRDGYRRPLPAATTDLLTRQTEGWAAGLHLFHLALPARTSRDRRIQVSGTDVRYASSYLDSQVLGSIPDHLVDFLRATSCFERLTAERCDDLLEARTSRGLLLEIVQRSGMVRSDDGGLSYRVHGVLRRHLETDALDAMPGPAAQRHYRKAATLLRVEQEHAAAVRVLTRVGDWEATSELLGRHGETILASSTRWVQWVPEWVVAGDPWLLLARARDQLDHGDVVAAAHSACRAGASSGDERVRRTAGRIQQVAELWAGSTSTAEGWPGIVHDAIRRDPCAATRRGPRPSPEDLVGHGLAEAMTGDLATARRTLRRAIHLLDHERPLTVARLGLAAISDDDGDAVEALLADETLTDHPWLSRLAQGLAAAQHAVGRPRDLDARMLLDEIEECDVTGDQWGALALASIRAVTLLRLGRPSHRSLEDVVARSHALGAATCEAWAVAAAALAAVAEGLPGAAREARSAEELARTVGVPGALALAYAARAATTEDGAELLALAEASADDAGLDLRPWTWVPSTPPLLPQQPTAGTVVLSTVRVTSEPPPVSVQCFGRFHLQIRGEEPNLGRVRPRARAVLRLLALESGRAVHREMLLDALWRDIDPVAGTHSLHVSVSSLRAVLEPGVPRGTNQVLVRDGERYQLAMPAGSFSDLVEFDRAGTDADRRRAAGDTVGAIAALDRALGLYGGEVLPEDGPAEWVIGTREHYRVRVAEVAATLAELHLARHDPSAAAAAALRSLDVDPCRDASWRLLLAAYTAAGDLAAAEQTRRSYAEVLTSLGVVSTSAAAVLARREPRDDG